LGPTAGDPSGQLKRRSSLQTKFENFDW